MRISLDDLDNRDKLAEKQRENLVNPREPLRTTRSRQRDTDPSINPLQPNIMTVGQVLMGSTTQVNPDELAKAYLKIAAQPFLDGSGDAGSEHSDDTINSGAEGSVDTSSSEGAALRGWGTPPLSSGSMIDVVAGANSVSFPGGVHVQIAPLVVALVSRIESATGELAKEGWCWGYASRKIRGGTSWSNHAWGLAIDFNAPNHPLGAEGTWSGKESELSQIAKDLGFRFGGDYQNRKDEMHFEFMGTPQDATRLTSPEVVNLQRLEGL